MYEFYNKYVETSKQTITYSYSKQNIKMRTKYLNDDCDTSFARIFKVHLHVTENYMVTVMVNYSANTSSKMGYHSTINLLFTLYIGHYVTQIV